MKNKIIKALKDAGIEVVNESYNEIHLKDNINLRIYNDNEEGLISWNVIDFKGSATNYIDNKFSELSQKERDIKYYEIFDESKFPDALEKMISKVDHSIGITWDTVDYYLHEYGLRDEEDDFEY